jgi:hypothetical protein
MIGLTAVSDWWLIASYKEIFGLFVGVSINLLILVES